MWYNIDLVKLSIENVPKFLRKGVTLGFLKAIIVPITQIYDAWIFTRNRHNTWLAHNGQICYLEKALNDAFDIQERRIHISNGRKNNKTYIYTQNEQKPKYLGKVHLFQTSDTVGEAVGFIVHVPGTILDLSFFEIEALINLYKDGAKTHKVERI